MSEQKQYDVGVIVGRFQLDDLHPAHQELIEKVINSHYHTVIVLGVSPLEDSDNNPLDFRTRKIMIQDMYPKVDVVYIPDMQYDINWSNKLDREIIKFLKRSNQTVCLYGGRSSFIPHYKGRYPTQELTLEQSEFISATARRNEIYNSVENNRDFRKGIIYQSALTSGKCIPATITIIYNEDHSKVLLGKRIYDREYTFISEKVKANETFEQVARSSVVTKTGIEPTDVNYISSFVIPDWEYRGENSQITAMVYYTSVMFGKAEAKENLASVKWVDIDSLPDYIGDMHKEIVNKIISPINKALKN